MNTSEASVFSFNRNWTFCGASVQTRIEITSKHDMSHYTCIYFNDEKRNECDDNAHTLCHVSGKHTCDAVNTLCHATYKKCAVYKNS
jgi:hypothetical protein